MIRKILTIAAVIGACGCAHHNVDACKSLGDQTAELAEISIRSCVESRKYILQSAYLREFRNNPGMKGSVTVDIEADKDGRIVSASAVGNPTFNQEFLNKISELMKVEFTFPASVSGWKGTYTFNFYP